MNQSTSRALRRVSYTSTGSPSKSAFRALKTLWKNTNWDERSKLLSILRVKSGIPEIAPWQTKKLARLASATPLSS